MEIKKLVIIMIDNQDSDKESSFCREVGFFSVDPGSQIQESEVFFSGEEPWMAAAKTSLFVEVIMVFIPSGVYSGKIVINFLAIL